MRYFFPETLRPPMRGAASGRLRPAILAGLPLAAEAHVFNATRTEGARAASAEPSSLFERARRRLSTAAERVWSELNDHAHVDRRAPPGRDPGGRRQREPDRGI